MNDDRVITEQAQTACYFRKVYFGNISIGVSEPSDKVVFSVNISTGESFWNVFEV